MDNEQEFDSFESPTETQAKALDLGPIDSVFLFTSNRGLDFVFNFADKSPVRLSLDWGRVADLDTRFSHLLEDAALMQTMGMSPYNGEHRESFVLAKTLGSTDA